MKFHACCHDTEVSVFHLFQDCIFVDVFLALKSLRFLSSYRRAVNRLFTV